MSTLARNGVVLQGEALPTLAHVHAYPVHTRLFTVHTLTWYGVVLQGEALPTLARVHAYPVHTRLFTVMVSHIPWHDMVSFCRVNPSLHWHVYTPIPSTHVRSQLHTLTWYGVVLQGEALSTLTCTVHAYPVHTRLFTVTYLDMIRCRSAGWSPLYTDTCTRLSRPHTFVHSNIPWHDMVSFCRVKPSLHWHVYTPIPSSHVCS